MVSMGLGGIVVSVCSAVVYMWLMGPEPRSVLTGALGLPCVLAGLTGAILQSIGWWKLLASRSITTMSMIPISIGLLLTLIGVSVARETLRLQDLDLTPLYVRHAEASQIGGFIVFIVFAAVNGLLITFCIWLVIPSNRRLPNEVAGATTD